MIFITGDTHGTTDIEKLYRINNYIITRKLNDHDNYVIVLGDFGYGWCPKTTSQMKAALEHLSFQLLFIDGNHENHDYLSTLSRTPMFGGLVGVVPGAPIPIYHLLRGGHYTIENQTFYTMGGAHSHDIAYRTPPYYTKRPKVWWSDELPTPPFLDAQCPPKSIDYILTHQAPQTYFPIDPATQQPYRPDMREQHFLFWLNELEYTTDYKSWFFGHWHIDQIMPTYSHKQGVALYNEVYILNGDKGKFM